MLSNEHIRREHNVRASYDKRLGQTGVAIRFSTNVPIVLLYNSPIIQQQKIVKLTFQSSVSVLIVVSVRFVRHLQ